MATASPKATAPKAEPKPELLSHEEWLKAHAACIGEIERVHAVKIVELEVARTKADSARAKAAAEAEAEHKAERLKRHEGAIGATIEIFKDLLNAGFPRTFEQVEVLGRQFRACEAVQRRLVGQPITNELAVAVCEIFAEKHSGALARFAFRDNWIPIFGFGIAIHTQALSATIRNLEFDLKAQLDAFLTLESTIARIGTAPGIQGVGDDEAAALWAIHRGCWPGDIDEAKRLAHVVELKQRAITQHTEETRLKISAILGDAAAREALKARGADVLKEVIKSARAILAFAGWDPKQAEEAAIAAARSVRAEEA